MRRAFIGEPIFQAEFIVQKGGSLLTFFNWYKKKLKIVDDFIPDENPYCRGRFIYHRGAGHAGIIWLHDKAGVGVITHECFHAVHQLMIDKGIKITEDSEEVFAYYQQFLVNEICRKVLGWK